MAVNPSPFGPKPQFELSDGIPAVGNQIFTYVAGSVNTKQNSYTDSTGGSANPNPIVLNSLGMTPNEFWFTSGQSYKVVYAPSTDTDPPTSPIWSIDNLRGINDTMSTFDQWVTFSGAPTFVSATSFTLVGDQTSTFQVGRRIKSTNSGGTIYSTVSVSAFGAITTVTVINDSGTLDAGLSAVYYSILSSDDDAVPRGITQGTRIDVASAATTNIGAVPSNYVRVTGAVTITGLGTVDAGVVRNVLFSGALLLTHNASSLILPGAENITTVAGDCGIFISEGSGNWRCTDYMPSVSFLRQTFAGGLRQRGLTLSNNAGDATNDIDIATGGTPSDDSLMYMLLSSALTKQLDAAWAVGTNQGMRATGAAIADTTYHIFLIRRPDTGVVDIAADTSATGANISANTNVNYTQKQRIGSILRESAAIVAFSQVGAEFLRSVPVLDINSSNPGTSAVSRTLSVPLGVKVNAVVNASGTKGTNDFVFYLSSLDTTDSAASVTAAPLFTGSAFQPGGGATGTGGGLAFVRTNTSSQIRSRISASGASDVLRIATLGWIDITLPM